MSITDRGSKKRPASATCQDCAAKFKFCSEEQFDFLKHDILEPVETTMLFDDKLTCSYSDLGDVVQAYRDYVTENYKYNSGSRLITSYESAYLVLMEFFKY